MYIHNQMYEHYAHGMPLVLYELLLLLSYNFPFFSSFYGVVVAALPASIGGLRIRHWLALHLLICSLHPPHERLCTNAYIQLLALAYLAPFVGCTWIALSNTHTVRRHTSIISMLYCTLCFAFDSFQVGGAYVLHVALVSMDFPSLHCMLFIAMYAQPSAKCASLCRVRLSRALFLALHLEFDWTSWVDPTVSMCISLSHCIKYLCRRYVSVSLEWSANTDGSHLLHRFHFHTHVNNDGDEQYLIHVENWLDVLTEIFPVFCRRIWMRLISSIKFDSIFVDVPKWKFAKAKEI